MSAGPRSFNRRAVAGLVGASLVAPALARVPVAQGAADSRIHIIDMGNAPFLDRDAVPRDLDGANACTRPNHLFLESLVNSGVDTVLRYYSDRNNANLNCKNVTRRERDLLHDHGLALAIVYQFEGRAPGRYTGARAEQDAVFCLERARVIGQPEGSTIFFGVDADRALNTDQGVSAYFRTVRRLFDGRFRVGIYAAGARCELIRREGLADAFWVPEAPAWEGTRAFLNAGRWTVYQNKTDIDKSYMTAGTGQVLHIDTDIVNPRTADSIGAFRSDGSLLRYDPVRLQAIVAARHWVTEDRIEVFDEPDSGANAHVCVARTVHVLERGPIWARVDTDEDGIANGYCRSSALAPLDRMPAWRRTSCKPMDI